MKGSRGHSSRDVLARRSFHAQCGNAETPGEPGVSWWAMPGSNRRPLPCEGSALPAAPIARGLTADRGLTAHSILAHAAGVTHIGAAPGRVGHARVRERLEPLR